MTTLKKELFFGQDSENENCHSHKIYLRGESVIISDCDLLNQLSNFIEIPLEDWEEINQFVNQEIKNNG